MLKGGPLHPLLGKNITIGISVVEIGGIRLGPVTVSIVVSATDNNIRIIHAHRYTSIGQSQADTCVDSPVRLGLG